MLKVRVDADWFSDVRHAQARRLGFMPYSETPEHPRRLLSW